MRILHISHSQLKAPGTRNYLLPPRINNGFVRNGHEVLWLSDRDIARHLSWFRSRKTGAGACNRAFVALCRSFEPDLIALSNADIVRPETVAIVRKECPDTAVLQYFIDPLFDASNFRNVCRKADVVDRTFVTTAGPVLRRLAGTRSRVAFMPNPVDASVDVHRCHERVDLPHDVFFAGGATRWLHPDDLRARAPELIRERLPSARVSFHGFDGHPPVRGAAFVRALGKARIGLNFSRRSREATVGPGGELYLYSSDRIGIYLGNGLLVFTTAQFRLSDLYGDAIVEVETADEFVERLRHFLENDDERRRVAAAGHALGHAEFNERLVTRYMIEATLGDAFSHPYRWPTELHDAGS